MQLHIRLKTTRTRSGYAIATLTTCTNIFTHATNYRFQFYSDSKIFNFHEELRSYIIKKYDVDIGNRKDFWGF